MKPTKNQVILMMSNIHQKLWRLDHLKRDCKKILQDLAKSKEKPDGAINWGNLDAYGVWKKENESGQIIYEVDIEGLNQCNEELERVLFKRLIAIGWDVSKIQFNFEW